MTLLSTVHPIALTAGNEEDSRILEEYAEFWKIPYHPDTEGEDSTVFTSDRTTALRSSRGSPVILTPRGGAEAKRAASDLRVSVRLGTRLLRLPVRRGVVVSLRTEVYEFSGSRIEPLMISDGIPILSRVHGTSVHLLALDLVTHYAKLVYEGFDESPNWRFSLVARLPFSYQLVPSFIRNRSFRSQNGLAELTEENLGPVECLRTIFLASLVKCSGPVPRIGFWRRGKACALAVTHDVETVEGLEKGARRLMEVEQALRIRSTWNIPSDRYSLTPVALGDLSKNGEIGAHDTRHDGRLVLLSVEKKTQRLSSCKARLEKLTGQKILGFRAPLLQHSVDLAEAASKAGYEFDSSCPSWEILSPTSLHSHGVGTVFPFQIGNILEIPVSLPQDHQLIRVAGQKPSAAVDTLHRLSTWIRGVGGACVILVHPDYEFAMAENKPEYNRLLENFRSDPECDIMTLGEMADWWQMRRHASIQVDNGNVSVISQEDSSRGDYLQAQLVTGYGEDGFSVVNLP